MLFAICFNLDQSKIRMSGNGLPNKILRTHPQGKKLLTNLWEKGNLLIASIFSFPRFLPFKGQSIAFKQHLSSAIYFNSKQEH